MSRPESPTRPDWRIQFRVRFTPTFSIIISKHLFGFIKFSFSKVSRPESLTRPERRIRTGARFTPTFLIIISKNLFGFIKFSFSIVSRPESGLDPIGGSKPEPGLHRRFQLSSQNICFVNSIIDFLITRKHFI